MLVEACIAGVSLQPVGLPFFAEKKKNFLEAWRRHGLGVKPSSFAERKAIERFWPLVRGKLPAQPIQSIASQIEGLCVRCVTLPATIQFHKLSTRSGSFEMHATTSRDWRWTCACNAACLIGSGRPARVWRTATPQVTKGGHWAASDGSANLVPQTKADAERNREAACCGSPRSWCCRRAVFAASTYRMLHSKSFESARPYRHIKSASAS